MTNTRRLAVFAALLATASPLIGCKKLQERAQQNAAENTLKQGKLDMDSEGGVTITEPNGQGSMSLGAAATLPADFPKDVPVYPGAKVTMAVQSNQAGKSGYIVTLQSTDAPGQVMTYYKANLKGFTPSIDMNNGRAYTLAMQNATTGTDLMMTASNGGPGMTIIQLNATAKK